MVALYLQYALELRWLEETDIHQTSLILCPSTDIIIFDAEYFTPEGAVTEANTLRQSTSLENLVVTGDSIVHISESEVALDCVEIP